MMLRQMNDGFIQTQICSKGQCLWELFTIEYPTEKWTWILKWMFN